MNKRLPKKPWLESRLVFFVSIIIALIFAASSVESQDSGFNWEKSAKFYSSYIQGEVLYLSGVFSPEEAELKILPFMFNHQTLFKNKRVLDIGTGSGIISLYAAKLGAKKVIATDIDKNAILSTQKNAQRLSFSNIIEVRYVPPQDISAYAVIKADETFDVIISNPPYSLVLDASENTSCIDKGDLGISIIKGIEKHLKSNGVAVLLYNSFFYHQVMVKFARYLGYEVKDYTPFFLTPLEAEAIFNYYLARVLKYQHLPPNAFRFNRKEDNLKYLPLIPIEQHYEKSSSPKQYPGIITIRKK